MNLRRLAKFQKKDLSPYIREIGMTQCEFLVSKDTTCSKNAEPKRRFCMDHINFKCIVCGFPASKKKCFSSNSCKTYLCEDCDSQAVCKHFDPYSYSFTWSAPEVTIMSPNAPITTENV